MRASAIRQLVSAIGAPRIAAAYFEHTVQIWDVRAAKRLAQFDTVYDFGGSRITLDAAGDHCITAAWTKGTKGGVACYESLSGSVIWHRTDIRHAQSVKFSRRGKCIWCTVQDGAAHRLHPRTGETLEKVNAVKRVYDSPHADLRLIERRHRNYFLKGKTEVQVPRLTAALLDAQFSTDSVCLSESGGPVRCVDTKSGEERWRYEPPKGTHVLRLGYRKADRCFYGVEREYVSGTARKLLRFAAEDGHRQELRNLRSWDETFCMEADCMVASNGEVVSLSDGRLVNRLAFPKRNYPD
jgi:hypothetical protein